MKCLQKVFIYDALHTGHETEELGKRGYLYTRQIRESFHSDEQAGKDISAAEKRAPLPSSTSTCPCTCACTCTCTCAYVHVHVHNGESGWMDAPGPGKERSVFQVLARCVPPVESKVVYI